MSWQCPICETVNQDVTPVCTVCDSLAPVIESFLSLESIEELREYNKKLDEIHRVEIKGDYERMLEIALDAIAIYKENGLAVEKAKQALKHLNEDMLKFQLSTLLNATIEKKNYLAATAVIRLIENLHLEISEFDLLKAEVKGQLAKEKAQLSKEREIDEILKSSYRSIILLQLDEASEIVDKGLKKYPSSKLLQFRREEIKSLKILIVELQKKAETKKKPFNKPVHNPGKAEPAKPITTVPIISLGGKKTKIPKVKRNK